jgi:predicted amidophosphoribosyltransferase
MPTAPWWPCCDPCPHLGTLESERLPLAAAHLVISLIRHSLQQLPFDWILSRPCPICRRDLAPQERNEPLCQGCRSELELSPWGLRGSEPLPWWGVGFYAGALRQLLLNQRGHPSAQAIRGLVRHLIPALPPWPQAPLLVPIPSWKRQANPLPPLICRSFASELGLQHSGILERAHPVLGQHHLKLAMRQTNQAGSFRCAPPTSRSQARRSPLLLVDDILTSGATACSAAACLEEAGWQVAGLLCLARTPPPGHWRRRQQRSRADRDLRSSSRQGDTPG